MLGTATGIQLLQGEYDTVDLSPDFTPVLPGTDYTADCWHGNSPDLNPANDTASGTFEVANIDVAVLEILAPAGQVPINTTVYPRVTLYNAGSFAASFSLYFEIDDLSDGGTEVPAALSVGAPDNSGLGIGEQAAPVDAISGSTEEGKADAIVFSTTQGFSVGPGETLDVQFAAPWTATPAGNFHARTHHSLANDTDRSNDTGDMDFEVTQGGNVDIGVTQILQPGAYVQLNTDIIPTATWRNYSSTDESSFTAWFLLESPTLGWFYAESEPVTLAAGEEVTLTFPTHNVAEDSGNWTARCSTVASGDPNPGNDVLNRPFTVGDRPDWPEGWHEAKPMPGVSPVKRGGWLALHGDGTIYATKGNKTYEYYRYYPLADSWSRMADMPLGEKYPDKGSKGISDGEQYIYATKGKNTLEFYQYNTMTDSWVRSTDVPEGPRRKKVKGGTDFAWVPADSMTDAMGDAYMLKGYYTEFYKFSPETSTWTPLTDAPIGLKAKYDKGSWIVYDGDNTIYTHKAKYYDRINFVHEFYKYDIAGDSWSTLAGMPLYGLHSGRIKKKKAKDGGAGAWFNNYIYALKGGNTQQFWMYDVAMDTWTESDTIPTIGSTGKKKRVKYGADLVHWGGGAFFALKGNKTNEMWRYMLPTAMAPRPARSGIMGGVVKAGRLGMTIAPNPLSGGYATVRYVLPKAGPATISVFDVTGRSVVKRDVLATRSGAVSLDARHLSAGIYLVRFEADDFTATSKLVVQH